MGLPLALQVWAVFEAGQGQAVGLSPARARELRQRIPLAAGNKHPRCLCEGAVKFPSLHNSLVYSELLSMTNSHLFAESK